MPESVQGQFPTECQQILKNCSERHREENVNALQQ